MSRPKRVLSFMSAFKDNLSTGNHNPFRNGNTTPPASPPSTATPSPSKAQHSVTVDSHSSSSSSYEKLDGLAAAINAHPAGAPSVPASPSTPHRREPSSSIPGSRSASRGGSRRNSLALGYQAPMMDINQDTPPELAPIFTYLNSHANKLYQEGYFLKLHDLDARGRPSADRVWNECFAQLVGTVLSLWDAAQLDAAGEDGEVVPTFINLTDASIKMIESLPMNGVDGQSLQNVLSISTAANNRYLLHFNSLHSLTQWTAGIRLAMYEHATLQEAYTGSILAGKGKHLNNIKTIMERSRFPSEDWARVRFGAGTPWRRCWCVITPPDEKAFAKAQKDAKKRSAYDRSSPIIKGDVKFYDTRKVTKKTRPIATITDAFAAYAIYPQSQPLIDNSTLIKVEGTITIHASQTTNTEGFIFVMPEVHPAISGFEMMLRWLIPCYDTFALYGRPNKLIADVVDTRSLMFAMPTSSRYGYLELIDVAGLIHTNGSPSWGEREWRRQMKVLTSKRITSGPSESGGHRRGNSRSSLNLPSTASKSSLNLPSSRPGIAFTDDRTTHSTPGSRHGSPAANNGAFPSPNRADTASPHKRSASDRFPRRPNDHGRVSFDANRGEDAPPMPPPHGGHAPPQDYKQAQETVTSPERHSSDASDQDYHGYQNGYQEPPRVETFQADSGRPLQPVQAPPAMSHQGGQRPPVRPNAMPDLRRANSAIDQATLNQMSEANMAGRGMHPDNAAGYQGQMAPGGPNVTPGSLQPNMPPYNGYGTSPTKGPSAGGHMAGRLPTIPGTPAVEAGNQFDAAAQAHNNGGRPPMHSHASSSGSMKRKPLPTRGPNPNANYQQQYY